MKKFKEALVWISFLVPIFLGVILDNKAIQLFEYLGANHISIGEVIGTYIISLFICLAVWIVLSINVFKTL